MIKSQINPNNKCILLTKNHLTDNIIIQPNGDIWSMWTEMLKKRCNFYNLTYNKNLKD